METKGFGAIRHTQQSQWFIDSSSLLTTAQNFDNLSRLTYPSPLSKKWDTTCFVGIKHEELFAVKDMQRSDRNTPNIILAPAPFNRDDVVSLYTNPLTIRNLIDDNLHSKVGEYVGLVHGNCAEYSYSSGLMEGGTQGLLVASALFRGVK